MIAVRIILGLVILATVLMVAYVLNNDGRPPRM